MRGFATSLSLMSLPSLIIFGMFFRPCWIANSRRMAGNVGGERWEAEGVVPNGQRPETARTCRFISL